MQRIFTAVLPLVCLFLGSSVVFAGVDGAGPGEAWAEKVLEEIWGSEYHFSHFGDDLWSAPNRAQNLRSTVTPEGLRVVPRTGGEDSWEFRLRFTGIGRADRLSTPAGRIRQGSSPDRIELVGGLVTEWFVNDPRGLEHGFDLASRPGQPSDLSPVVLEITVGGDVSDPQIEDRGRRVSFRSRGGSPAVVYRDLLVLDAEGRNLPATLQVAHNRLRIVIDDTAAVYPVVVDPLITQADWSVDSGQSFARLGGAISSAGDVNADGYDDVIIGADKFDNGQDNEGRIFVFHGSANGLETTPAWIAEGNQVDARFGKAVACAGNVNGDTFAGKAVDDIIVGARDYDDFIDTGEGGAFVYHGSSTGLDQNGTRPSGHPLNADWRAEGNQSNAGFGVDVNSAGDVNNDGFDDVIIGADEYTNEQTDEGAAFVFHGSPSGLDGGGSRVIGDPLNADWIGESDQVEADYGFSVAWAGDVNDDGFDDVIVGSPVFQNNFDNEGRVYLYLGSASGVQTTPVWMIDGQRDLGHLGYDVAAAGDVNGDGFDDVIIGAADYTNGQSFEGAALIFFGEESALLGDAPDWFGESNQGSAAYGVAVAGLGDFNADGYDDVIVGASNYANGHVGEGAAFLYFGGPEGPATLPDVTYEVDQEDAEFGAAVASAGDVQADGYPDLLISAVLFTKTPPLKDEGAAFAYWGCPDTDRDGVCQAIDNCLQYANSDQLDTDGDGKGDPCDSCKDLDDDGACDEPHVLLEGSGPGEQVLVEFGSPMKYLANVEDPLLGLTWTAFFYPDFTWDNGQYGVGYESASGAENLIISEVAPANCIVTATCPASVYTRTDFVISDPALVNNVFFGADYDDGYAAWINGIEVYRSAEMPVETPTWNSPVSSGESSNATVADYGELVDISATALPILQPGLNTLAVGVWNVTQNSSDLVLVPRLSINRAVNPSMRFQANTADPGGVDWTTRQFSDIHWNEGSYGVGYEAGSGAENLLNLQVPIDSLSVYSRASFYMQPSDLQSLTLGADYDDGYAAWLNGVEIYRSPELPPSGPLAWNTNPTPHESSNGINPTYTPLQDVAAIASTALVLGENVLSVAVYRNDANIDDLVVVPKLTMNEQGLDNCVDAFNPDQSDIDDDGLGDACDPDIDADGQLNESDNCPYVSNAGQGNLDGDIFGDACDFCPDDSDNDADLDGICAGTGFEPPLIGDADNCPTVHNPGQENEDGDSLGDVCDPDIDDDGVLNAGDNCPYDENELQTNLDGDTHGEACDCDDSNLNVWEIPGAVESLCLARADVCHNRICSESLGACGDDTDCLFDACEDYACSESLGACGDDTDCETDTCENFTCTVGGGACTGDGECTADVCVGKECTASLIPCADDIECTADFCTNKTCLVSAGPCNTTTECPGGPGDICLGECSVSPNICADDAPCTADRCLGACTAGTNACADDSECTADLCEGACSIGANTCIDDTVCVVPQTDLCEGSCSVGANVCTGDDACVAPQTDLCGGVCTLGNNACVDDTACTQPDADALVWLDPSSLGAVSVVFDTLRSNNDSQGFETALCLESDQTDHQALDSFLPSAGELVYYLVRVKNDCPSFNMGTQIVDNEETPRVGVVCP